MSMHIKSCSSIKVTNINNLKRDFLGKDTLTTGDFKLEMDQALNSVNSKELLFTNMLKSKKDDYYKFIRKIYFASKNNQLELINEFNIENLTYKSEKNKNRTFNILNLTHDNKFTKIPNMIKCKHVTNKAFQFLIEWIDVSTARINLIDVHHLVFPAKDVEHEEKYVDKKAKYDAVKDFKINLSEIKDN